MLGKKSSDGKHAGNGVEPSKKKGIHALGSQVMNSPLYMRYCRRNISSKLMKNGLQVPTDMHKMRQAKEQEQPCSYYYIAFPEPIW